MADHGGKLASAKMQVLADYEQPAISGRLDIIFIHHRMCIFAI
jgi:hypothetical protein